jgi:alpha-mannosidase
MTYSAIPSSVQTSAVNREISDAIQRLRQLNQLDMQSHWRSYQGDLPLAQVTSNWQSWQQGVPNSRNQITWAKGRQVLWLAQRIVVPPDLQGYILQGLALRLGLSWWAVVAQIYINGELVQEGDIFDSSTRILLSPAIQVGDVIELMLRLESPGHADGALVQAICLYELASQAVDPTPEPAFVADEIAVLQEFLNAFAPARLEELATAIAQLPWAILAVADSTITNRASFDAGLVKLRIQLQPLADLVKQRQIQMVGHAHLDLAWLWSISETWQAAENTFRSVLSLQQEFPELVFCHTSPALYDWIEQHRPDLFVAIQARVQAGSWDVTVGPMWLEPEMNLGNGESIARHLLYGQRYLQQKFGQSGSVAWLPDTFGFNWQLPQLLKQAGVNYFVTQKLRWNDTTQFPYMLHQWQAPDGSQVLSLHSAPIGEGIDPVKMARYICDWERKTGCSTALWVPGVGDHGGGPTRDMLELARRWQQSAFFPQLSFTTAQAYLEAIQAESPASTLPTWNSELYLEFHRGCYTNHADQKRFNRRCEDVLYEAELFAALHRLLTGAAYPQAELEAAWKQVLFNHFHDILPGTSIAAVYADANRDWQAALDTGWNLRQQAMQGIAAEISLPVAPPQARLITIFNALSWSRSDVVSVSVEQTQDQQACFWQICDLNGDEIPSQPHCWREGDKTYCQIFFQATVPAVGYCCFWLLPRPSGNPVPTATTPNFVLENDRLRVAIDPATGNLSTLFDKLSQRHLLNRPGNELQAFQDQGQYWDAWNIDPHYAQQPLSAAQLMQIVYEDQGSLITQIRVIRQIGKSRFNQIYRLDQRSAVLKIITQVDWQERHVLVKAAFGFDMNAAYATYEIPYGMIQRPTCPQTEAEKAQWEVSALRWADLSDTSGSYGVSLLSDCKHGYDAKPSQLRLSLLRGSEWPDPDSDRGLHQFTYAVYPHDLDWKAAQTVRRGYELNQPLSVMVLDSAALKQTGTLPPKGECLNLPDNLVLSALKPAEDHSNDWLLRCYECHGAPAAIDWQTCLSPLLRQHLDSSTVQRTNLLEQPLPEQGASQSASSLAAWQIATYRFQSKS